MSKAISAEPTATIRFPGGLAGTWNLTGDASIAEDRRGTWLGFPFSRPTCINVENAGRLGGDYALIAAQPEGLLLASGSPAGRTLNFARRADGCLLVCSRVEPLIACLPEVSPNIRTLSALMMARGCNDPGATVFQEIRRLEAREAVLFALDGTVAELQSGPNICPRQGSSEEFAEELRTVLARAVSRSIEGARRVAVLVGGGLDSSSILALAAAAARGAKHRELDAIAWSFAGPGDDRPYLDALCADLGIVPVRVTSIEASSRVLRALIADAMPLVWPTAAAIWLAHERARERGADVILTGMGGDQAFNGDARAIARDIWSGNWLEAISFAAHYGASPKSTVFGAAKFLLGPPIMSIFPVIERGRRRRFACPRWPWAGPALRRSLREDYVREAPNRDWLSPIGQLRLKRIERGDVGLLAANRRQMEAAVGLKQVDPLLDDEVLTFIAGLPQRALFFGNRQRGLFREAMRPLLVERIRLRSSKARFEPAVAEMVLGSDVRALRDLAKMRMLADLGLVEPELYQHDFEAVLAARTSAAPWLAVWPALAVEAFARAHWGERTEEEPWSASA